MRQSIIPSDHYANLIRRKNDERVEVRGSTCKIYRQVDIDPADIKYDDADDIIMSPDTKPTQLDTRVILNQYQTGKDRVGTEDGREFEDLPIIATLRFIDNILPEDIIEVAYTYALKQSVLVDPNGYLTQVPEDKELTTRFKVTNRNIKGVNIDWVNQYFVVPSQENWEG